MKKRTKSLLEEINAIAPNKDVTTLIESRGSNSIMGIVNLLEMIEKEYGQQEAQDLIKRVMLSIKNRNTERFLRGIKKIRDNK